MISRYNIIKPLILVLVDDETLEFKRQMIHLLNGSTIAAAVYFLKPSLGLWVLAPLVAALFLLHAMPKIRPDLRVMNILMYHFERRRDIENFPFKGAIFYGLGIIFPIVLLDRSFGCAVILVLSVGDAFSNLIGRRWGTRRILDKSLEGSLGFLFTSWAAVSLLLDPLHAFALAFAGAVIELFSFWDDNVTIPAGLSLMCFALGWGV
jgi:phytol kinase